MTAMSPAAPRSPAPAPNPWWFTPPMLIGAPVLLSLSAWTLIVVSCVTQRYSPEVSTKLIGFDTPAPVSVPGVVLLATFYLFMALVALLGWLAGSARVDEPTGPGQRDAPICERRYFLLILPVAVIGVGYCYFTVATQRSIIGALSSQTSNQLYDSLPQNAGVQTLRYACILAAPLGVHLWRKGVIGMPLMVFAVLLLGLNALLSSRLSLLMATCVYLTIRVRTREAGAGRRRSAGAVLGVALVGFLLLTMLNYTRNANFYRELGVADPVTMNLYQSSQYVTVPAQVSLGVANSVSTGKWHVVSNPMDSLDAITPTFLQEKKVRKADTKKYSADYGYSSTFAPQYFTNSVFADTYAEFGAWGWFYCFLIYGMAGFLLARLMQAQPVVAATGGVIAYCFAEVWRIQILSYGFVIFLLLLTAACARIARITPAKEDRPESGSAATAGARSGPERARTVEPTSSIPRRP